MNSRLNRAKHLDAWSKINRREWMGRDEATDFSPKISIFLSLNLFHFSIHPQGKTTTPIFCVKHIQKQKINPGFFILQRELAPRQKGLMGFEQNISIGSS
jgi:hypothetical protein